jgi:hypothetical protein
MSFDATSIFNVIVSHAMASGAFERVNQHEPKNAPGNGLTCAVWIDRIEPVKSSGLISTSTRASFMIRVYSSMLQEPQDAIDPNIVSAVDVLMTAYSGDFELGSNVRDIDLLGAYGIPLSAQAGYINQDNKLYRVMTITLPVIVNDVWVQTP